MKFAAIPGDGFFRMIIKNRKKNLYDQQKNLFFKLD